MAGQPPKPTLQQETFTMPFVAGEVVGGKYEIRKLIGVGNIGYVVSALRTELGDEVALKFLRPELTANHDLVARFAREARFAVRIKSEHVASVFDVGTLANGVPFIVMERLEGRDLARVLAEKGRLPPAVALEFALQACEALASAHAKGIVHRDVKPENLFLARLLDGRSIVKVLDFGISKVALTGSFDNTVPLVRTIAPMGSPVYMSPEQICAMILEKDPLPLRTVNPEVDPGIEALVGQCLEKDPSLRFQTVGELAVALAAFAPEHARVWAERCCYVLNNAEANKPEPEEVHVVRPRSGSSGGVAISIAAPPKDVSLAEEDVSFRPARPWKRLTIPAVAGAAVAAWFAFRTPSNGATLPPAQVEAPAPSASAKPVAPPPEVESPPPVAEIAPKPEPVAAPAAPVKAVRKPNGAPAPGPKPSKEKPPRVEPPRPNAPVESEPDVGF
jgi:serine/threonine-protein kinase